MKKSVRLISILSVAAMAFSIGVTPVSAYCGLSAADLARANAQNNQNYAPCNVYGYCSDCGSYESLCAEGTCGDCEATATANGDCGVCYDCRTGGDCEENTDCGVCYDCRTGGDCETGTCPDATVTPVTETPVKETTPETPTKSTKTNSTYDINSLIRSILSRLFIQSDIDFGDYIQIPAETEPKPVETTPAPVETQPKPVETQPKPVETTPTQPVITVPVDDCEDYAVEMLAMINEARAEVGAPALKLSSELCNAANIRAKEISTSFSHTRPSGNSFYSVLDDIGYSSRGSGENIAAGNSGVSATFTQWMESQGHYENMINANYKYVGIGYYQTSSGYKHHWVQIFSY
ncbi:MAG: CAP domain-containing protein [Ruminococcus sp.]|nr:CAP domain-containing protein [Ruminococcus sp.]